MLLITALSLSWSFHLTAATFLPLASALSPSAEIVPITSNAHFARLGKITGIHVLSEMALDIEFYPLLRALRQRCADIETARQNHDEFQAAVHGASDENRTIHSDLHSLFLLASRRCHIELEALSDTIRRWVSTADWLTHPLLQKHEDLFYRTPHAHLGADSTNTDKDIEDWRFSSPVWDTVVSGRDDFLAQREREVQHHQRANGLTKVNKAQVKPKKRIRRQAAVATAGVLAFIGLSGWLSKIFSHPVPAQNTLDLGVLDQREADNEADLHNLTALSKWNLAQVTENTDEARLIVSLIASDMLSSALYDKAHDITSGVVSLLHRTLDPRLVPPQALESAFEQVTKDLQRLKAKPILSGLQELYSLDVSHSFNIETLSLNVSIKVPGEVVGETATLLRFVPFPITLDTSTVLPEPTDSFLAITDDLQYYRTYSSEELFQCVVAQGTYLCPNSNIMTRREVPHCLTSLYNLDKRNLSANCLFSAARTEASVIQISTQVFHTYTREASFVDIDCAGRSQRRDLGPGLNKITLSIGCEAVTSTHRFQPTPYLHGAGVTWEVRPVDLLSEASPAEVAAFHQLLQVSHQALQPPGLALHEALRTLQQSERATKAFNWQYYLLTPVLASLFLGLFFFALSRCVNFPLLFRCLTCRLTEADRNLETHLLGFSWRGMGYHRVRPQEPGIPMDDLCFANNEIVDQEVNSPSIYRIARIRERTAADASARNPTPPTPRRPRVSLPTPDPGNPG